MSSANGYVFQETSPGVWVTVAYFEYAGTSDIAVSHLYDSPAAVWHNKNTSKWLVCTCGNPPVSVMLMTDYGGGRSVWPGEVCFECRAIVSGDPYGD